MHYQINLQDPTLFGQDDARYEEDAIFDSFSIHLPKLKDIINNSIPYLGIKAPKGSGKTALFRIANGIITKNKKDISLLCFDSDIVPDATNLNEMSEWIAAWKKSILITVAKQFGSEKFFALTADDVTLVEFARAHGHAPRNLISSIMERIRTPWGGFNNISVASMDAAIMQITERALDKFKHNFWIWIDEVDQQFGNTDKDRLRIASMIIAARQLTRAFSCLRIRFTIRPNILAILETTIASIANHKEHIHALQWDVATLRKLLAKRIEAYLIRTGQYSNVRKFETEEEKDEWFISLVFKKEKFDLGNGERSPHVVLSILSARRPRWLIELCKKSIEVSNEKSSLINIDHVKEAMFPFGQERIKNLSAEYAPQCKDIAYIIEKFVYAPKRFEKFHNLLNFIKLNILSHATKISISGCPESAKPNDIVRLLYQIEFIQPLPPKDNPLHKHLKFDERPSILASNTFFNNTDNPYAWEIYPTFRNCLYIKT